MPIRFIYATFTSMNRFWRHWSSSVMTSVAVWALVSSANLGWTTAAHAATDVKLRGSDHSGYSRLVFEWPETPHYTVSKTPDSLTIHFSNPADIKQDGTAPETLSRITALKVLNDKSVELDVPKGMDIRHFVIGNRIIVDVQGPEQPKKEQPKKEPSEKPVEKTPEAKQPETKQPETKQPDSKPVNLTQKIEEEKKPETAADPTEDALANEIKQVAQKVDQKLGDDKDRVKVDLYTEGGEATPESEAGKTQKAEPELAPYQINMAATTSFAMAAFEKGNKIWIVYDKPDVIVPPQIEGQDSEKFGTFKKIPLEALSVFTLDRPKGYKLHGAGGGLVWKINLESKPEKYKAKPFEHNFEQATENGPSLLFPAGSFHRAASFTDPLTGEDITVLLVDAAQDYSGGAQKFSQLETLPGIIGAAFINKTGDITVEKGDTGAIISREGGLALSSRKDILPLTATKVEKEPPKDKTFSRIFDFKNWNAGTSDKLADNQRLILSGLFNQTNGQRAENLVYLGRLMLSSGFSPEATGYFEMASDFLPDLKKSPEFIALQGASQSMSGNYKDGFYQLSNPSLADVDEINLWKSYALSGLDDWQQAAKILPDRLDVLKDYSNEVLWPVGLRLAEVTLREGNIKKSEEILETIKNSAAQEKMPLPYRSALTYLEGELARQKGNEDKAKELWSGLESGKDDLYRAKSRLAMASMRLKNKEITIDKAIDTLEGLRYAWRGDELETAINFNLGKMYLEKGEPVKALGLMRQAASLIPGSEQSRMINDVMKATFKELYMTDKIQSLSPVEAMTLYDEFSELVPPGVEGDRLARQLAERLVDVDLLPRAINLLKKQVNTGLSGLEGASVAIRLASLELMDQKPQNALETMNKAEELLSGMPSEESDPKKRSIAMLRAKAYAQLNNMDQSFASLSLLPQDKDVLRLRADIAWKAKKWQEAADALEQIIAEEKISKTRPLEAEQSKLILDWAVALYLADNRYVLANLRERFSDMMANTDQAKEFDVVTRPRQNILLADRETIRNVIGETEIFKDFMNSFKEDLKGPLPPNSGKRNPAQKSAAPTAPAQIPEELKNIEGVKADEVLAD